MKSDRLVNGNVNTKNNKNIFHNDFFTKNQSWRRKGFCYKIVFIVIVIGSSLYFLDFSFLNLTSQIDYYAKIIKRKHQSLVSEYFHDFSLEEDDDYEHYLGEFYFKF